MIPPATTPPTTIPPATIPQAAGAAPMLPDCERRRLSSDLFHALSQPLTALCCSLELVTLQQTPRPNSIARVSAVR